MTQTNASRPAFPLDEAPLLHEVPVTMTTLQIGNEWLSETPGGLQRYYSELLQALPGTGTDYTGLVVGSEAVARETNGKVIAFAAADAPLLQRLLACRRKASSLKEHDLTVVHFALYGLPLLDQLLRRPSVVHFHGPWADESIVDGSAHLNTRVKAWIESTVYRKATRLITLSKAFRRELVQGYGVEEDRVRVVPGGVDIHRFNTSRTRREARESLGWPQDRLIILSVRRQVRRMGLENLIEAVRTLVFSFPEILLLLGGTGPIAAELESRIQRHGLQQHVRLLGRISDGGLPTAYRASDLSIVPTQALEGFGLITLESLAAGTPVLVTPVGGLPEIITPFAPQCIFPGTTTEEICDVLRDFLIGGRTLPSQERCRQYIVDNFSSARIAGLVRTVYDEALA